ncbi:hypothetical protein VD0002_g244 [Verticillium dahliae]|uniref:Uncharacterized protein n=1 Tax=Verticillium dahliae TaxID=27337 RepID=A0AA45AIB8_VERDA|nr:hypothetical protein VdG2_00490 [Verticillium dahliae VDG2]PNH27997.1 hypothetical protein BJF96_g8766 [Verticillium dahliae]PNH41990.1 hypothetical protein VD0004_g5253 [Verticillium dahliae]PNH51988.1 hypothetical protein VD0003_g5286 [Verticillium dahliae]PNH70417.1 hypothetical protein VD0002_g244 [Verticillium dahliae]
MTLPSPSSSPPRRASRPKQPRTQSAPLHPRTRTPPLATIVPTFLAQPKCTRCTVRVVHVSTPDKDKPDQTQRAVVEWGAIPYYKTTGRPAEFVYYTTERASDLRPELLAAWHAARARGLEIGGQTAPAGSSSSPSSSSSSSSTSSSTGQMPDWISERLRDCWVVEQLVYWVEFLQEWKYYRDYYVFREELFDGEVPEILCQGCKDCSGRLAALVPLPDCDLESVPAETEVPPLNRSTSQPESGKMIVTESCCELKLEACD